MLNIPNLLTLSRIILIPVLVVAFYWPGVKTNVLCVVIFTTASLTDLFDGYLARKLNQTSDFGAFLDPVADKLMVATALVILVESDPTPWLAIPAAIIIGREITISALREWMANLGKKATVAVSYIGKIKTTAQMSSIGFLLYSDPFMGYSTSDVGYVLLYVAAGLTLWSMFDYMKAAWKSFS
ncbi:MAG: CDP-diacylglycerol--glycerol-3-phosphate 3-phosphatidyltransferase [Methylococcales bacterium]|jgi:CDP-diacylglycerol--glycerol-3-phosphate 3-phosphatidyltransferase|nr:CDP-diacylglycerol--glycerol-3-phosphate 3-phosphatidyltransferase [Methylococcales bacterium]MBT7410646.1 CDP-diacylglycerol--glycerol-3-phosphate 3-phosphatidyltransferase [Methylococcales bacterium]